MTKLDCNVCSCIHNADNCCCKNTIQVEGQTAKTPSETCCCSFSENKDGSFKNMFKTPEKQLHVACDAYSCVHNQNRCCTAGHIAIAGGSACTADQTACESFCAK